MPMNKQRNLALVAAVVTALVAAGAAAAGSSLSLVAYSTPKTVLGKIIQAWQQTPGGKDVTFSQSYGASTDQARAVGQGLKADVVFLSTGDDVNLLVDAGLVVSGTFQEGRLVEIVELRDHPWFVASQFHPEFKSRPTRPAPLFRDFVGASFARSRERSGVAVAASRAGSGSGQSTAT